MFSTDSGETWSENVVYANFPKGKPIRTWSETEVNWVVTYPGNVSEWPRVWRAYTAANGGPPLIPENFTSSGGAQNRIIYGLHLPARDKALLRVGFSVYYARPLKITYVFKDSNDPNYGLRNMRQSFIRFYDYGASEYVGGLGSASFVESLAIAENEHGKIELINVAIPPDTIFALLARKDVDTRVDENGDGIPDNI